MSRDDMIEVAKK